MCIGAMVDDGPARVTIERAGAASCGSPPRFNRSIGAPPPIHADAGLPTLPSRRTSIASSSVSTATNAFLEMDVHGLRSVDPPNGPFHRCGRKGRYGQKITLCLYLLDILEPAALARCVADSGQYWPENPFPRHARGRINPYQILQSRSRTNWQLGWGSAVERNGVRVRHMTCCRRR